MSSKKHIVLIGEFTNDCQQLLSSSLEAEITVSKSFSSNTVVDLLILEFNGEHQAVLASLSALPKDTRPALIAILPKEDNQVLRQAMHNGAHDFLIQPLDKDNLLLTVQQWFEEAHNAPQVTPGKTIAVMSASSNAEAAFISGNLAHAIAVKTQQSTVLIDLDHQYSSLPLLLDMELDRSFLKALDSVDSLDEIAIDAYLSKHPSGLKLLGLLDEEISLPGEISIEDTRKIISIASRTAKQVFINLPHVIDPLTSQVMEDADSIAVCVEQRFSSINYAKGLLNVLQNELDIPALKIIVVVNNYRKDSKIKKKDIEKTLGIKQCETLPFDNASAVEAEQYSLLLNETADESQATLALNTLAERFSELKFPVEKGLLSTLRAKLGGR